MPHCFQDESLLWQFTNSETAEAIVLVSVCLSPDRPVTPMSPLPWGHILPCLQTSSVPSGMPPPLLPDVVALKRAWNTSSMCPVLLAGPGGCLQLAAC